MPAATPVGCVSPLCSHLLCIFHTWLRQHCRRLLLAAGLVWLQCDHRVLTATHEFWCNPGDIAARCPGTGSTWHSRMLIHTCLLHTLCCCKFGCSMGTGFSTAAHTECGAILIQQYQGVQAHCACSMWVQRSHSHARRKCAASLCSLVCDCYRVLTTAHRVVRAELTSTTPAQRYRRGLGTAHT
jgi:hypothetical protein